MIAAYLLGVVRRPLSLIKRSSTDLPTVSVRLSCVNVAVSRTSCWTRALLMVKVIGVSRLLNPLQNTEWQPLMSSIRAVSGSLLIFKRCI